MTQAELFAAVRALGLTIRKTGHGDELRVAFTLDPISAEASAYYTDDRQDALDTARAMKRAELLTRDARIQDRCRPSDWAKGGQS